MHLRKELEKALHSRENRMLGEAYMLATLELLAWPPHRRRGRSPVRSAPGSDCPPRFRAHRDRVHVLSCPVLSARPGINSNSPVSVLSGASSRPGCPA